MRNVLFFYFFFFSGNIFLDSRNALIMRNNISKKIGFQPLESLKTKTNISYLQVAELILFQAA